ncbi:High-affnity carbon uptake protein Hat/HatR [Fimbriiglobus ruber]|uniref:High-affnity carbon uptake protein Hat/HatR n=2 Tax=Fimbriiglobus ruber TaxID=1908690 RepID=A0A225E2P7_9BACT|nr:High-affnity carbon uptake protein Hat/HatR [Fimbriiglobus ruber]
MPRIPRRTTLATIALAVGCGWLAAQPPQPPQPLVILKGHTDPIYTVAVSPDGKFAATGSFDKTIKLWDPTTGKELRTLAGKNGHQNQVLCLAFSPAGDTLASGGSDNVVKLWDVPSSKPSFALDFPAGVTATRVSADGTVVAAGGANGVVKLWTVADKKARPDLTGHSGAVVGLGFAPNGATVYTTGADKTLRYWNATTGEAQAVVGASAADITGLAVNPASGVVVTASADGSLKFWPAQAPAAPKPLAPHTASVTALGLSPDGGFAVTGGADKVVRLANTATGAKVQEGKVAADPRVVAAAANGQGFAAGTVDDKLTLWGADGKPRDPLPAHDGAVTGLILTGPQQVVTAGADGYVRNWTLPTPNVAPLKPTVHPDRVLVAVPLADGKQIATGGADKIVRICKDGAVAKQFPGHEAAVTAIAEAGANLITGDAAGGLLVWEVASGKKTVVVPAGPKVGVTAVVPQPGGAGFAVVYSTGEVQFRPVAVAKEKEKTQEPKVLAHPAAVLAAAFTTDGKKLLTVCADKSLRTWAIDTAKADAPIALTPAAIKLAAFTADRTKLALVVAEAAGAKLLLTPLTAGAKPVFEAGLAGEPEALALSPTAARIAVAVAGKTGRSVRVLDAITGRTLQTVAEPTAPVHGLAILADNKTIAVGGDDKQLGLFDLAVTSALLADPAGVTGLAINPATGHLITAGADKTVRVWDATQGKEVKAFAPLPAPATALAASRDGTAVAAASGKVVRVWTVADGKEVPFPATATDVTALSFSPDKTKLLVGQADNRAWVYDVATGQPLQFAAHTAPVTAVAFHPAQPVFYTASADKTVTASPLLVVKSITDPAVIGAALAVVQSGSHVLTAGTGKGVTLWNAGSYAKDRTLEADAPVTAVAVSKNGQLVAVAHGADPGVTLFNFNDGSVVGKFKTGAKVTDLSFHPTNPTLATVLANNSVVAWGIAFEAGQPLPAEFGKPVQDFPHPGPVRAGTFNSDGTTIVTGADDKQVRVWKFAADQPAKTLQHPNLVDAVAFDKTGGLLATGCHDGILRVWDVAKGTATKTINAHILPQPNPIYAVAWTLDGKQIVTSSFDKTIKFWDAGDGKMVREIKPGTDRIPPDPLVIQKAGPLAGSLGAGWLNAPPEPGHRDQVFCLAFDKDGKYLASGSSDRLVKLWDVATGRLVHEFPNPTLPPPPPGQPAPSHPGFVHALKFTADGSKLITVGTAPRGAGYLAEWAVADGKLLAAQELPFGPIYSLDLLPSGAVLLGCGPKTRFQSESEAVVIPLPVK